MHIEVERMGAAGAEKKGIGVRFGAGSSRADTRAQRMLELAAKLDRRMGLSRVNKSR